MWHNTRRGYNLVRKRKNDRKVKLNIFKVSVILGCFILLCLLLIGIYGIYRRNISLKHIAAYNEIYSEKDSNIVIKENKQKVSEEQEMENKKTFTLIALGELMMGGQVTSNLNYNYMIAFKNVVEYTKNADYTIANLTTNITNLDEIENPKSKHIVTKSILNAFNALGIDAVNVASDHMLDFGNTMFSTTKNIIENEGYNIIGLENNIIYAENNGIKVAFIGVNNEIIGSAKKYKEAGIFIYDLKKIKSEIKKAKETANSVIIMAHLGLENRYWVTDIMRWLYKELIDSGADMVLGSHAIGIYPIEMYKGKPIIYSLGYFMHDTNNEIGKKSAIFKFVINEEGKIEKLHLIPTYIKDKKEVMLYSEYNLEQSIKFINSIKTNNKQINQTVTNNMLMHEF